VASLDEVAKEQLEQCLKGMRFGTVEITVHNGEIVQIERRERVRMDLRRAAAADPRPAARPGCSPR
jgi:hypothetical protein